MIRDVVIAGGGVVGCATARALGGLRVEVIEQEPDVALHQSGRNSGVIHPGYNAKPGTLKARFCVEGSRRLRAFCRERGVPMVEGGILVVARDEREVAVLRDLLDRGRSNGARVAWVDRVRDIEPEAAGIAGLHAPEGASFDSRAYVKALYSGVSLNERVLEAREGPGGVRIRTSKRTLDARVFVNAAGAQADRFAHAMGVGRDVRVVPFRGEYLEVRADLVRSHVYSAPDPRFPFLGVHLSRRVDGTIAAGPTASLHWPDVPYAYGGLWKLLPRLAPQAFRSDDPRALVPALRRSHLGRRWYGVRAQLVSTSGELVDDFRVEETDRSVHVLNAVSPALTCSLPLADDLAARVRRHL